MPSGTAEAVVVVATVEVEVAEEAAVEVEIAVDKMVRAVRTSPTKTRTVSLGEPGREVPDIRIFQKAMDFVICISVGDEELSFVLIRDHAHGKMSFHPSNEPVASSVRLILIY